MVKFLPDSCIFTILDDGRCIMLDEDEETKELITNYKMIRKTAASVRYQYILNLNYTVFTFKCVLMPGLAHDRRRTDPAHPENSSMTRQCRSFYSESPHLTDGGFRCAL